MSIARASSCQTFRSINNADGVDINLRSSPRRQTALHSAASLGLFRAAELLVHAGADLDVVDEIGLTPLMYARSEGKVKGSRIAMLLIEAGADVTYRRDEDEMSALEFAVESCSPAVIQALIDRGVEVDSSPNAEQTPLMHAAQANNMEALELLIRNGADPTRPCGLPWAKGLTALGLAKLEGWPSNTCRRWNNRCPILSVAQWLLARCGCKEKARFANMKFLHETPPNRTQALGCNSPKDWSR